MRFTSLITSVAFSLLATFVAGEARSDFDPYRYIVRRSEDPKVVSQPEYVRISTPNYDVTSSDFKPRIGLYQYDLSWTGIPAATALVEVKRSKSTYQVGVKVKTARAIDLFYRLRADFEGAFARKDFSPINGQFYARENSKVKFTRAAFRPNGYIFAEHGKTGKETNSISFNPGNNTLDPFSAAFLARGMAWAKGEERVFDTYNGKSRFLVGLKCIGSEIMEFQGQPRKVWVIEPKAKKVLSDSESKLRDARIFVSADANREIVRIESEVFIGSVVAELATFEANGVMPSEF